MNERMNFRLEMGKKMIKKEREKKTLKETSGIWLTLGDVSDIVLLLPGVEAGSDKDVSIEPSEPELGKLFLQSNVTNCRHFSWHVYWQSERVEKKRVNYG